MTTTRDLSEKDIAIIKARALRGDRYAEIASDFRLNQGRVADIKFGRIRPDICPAILSPSATQLPDVAPLVLLVPMQMPTRRLPGYAPRHRDSLY